MGWLDERECLPYGFQRRIAVTDRGDRDRLVAPSSKVAVLFRRALSVWERKVSIAGRLERVSVFYVPAATARFATCLSYISIVGRRGNSIDRNGHIGDDRGLLRWRFPVARAVGL